VLADRRRPTPSFNKEQSEVLFGATQYQKRYKTSKDKNKKETYAKRDGAQGEKSPGSPAAARESGSRARSSSRARARTW